MSKNNEQLNLNLYEKKDGKLIYNNLLDNIQFLTCEYIESTIDTFKLDFGYVPQRVENLELPPFIIPFYDFLEKKRRFALLCQKKVVLLHPFYG
jgi:hypothetical protein